MYTDNNKAQGKLQYPCRPSSAFLVLVHDTVLINEEHIYTFASKALGINQTSWSSLHHPRVWSEVWFVRIDTRMRMQLWCHWGCGPPCTADPQVDAKTPSICFCCKTAQPNLFFLLYMVTSTPQNTTFSKLFYRKLSRFCNNLREGQNIILYVRVIIILYSWSPTIWSTQDVFMMWSQLWMENCNR